MKPSTDAVAARLGLAVAVKCRHDWRMHGKLHRDRAHRDCMTYRCANCGEVKHEAARR